MATDNLAFEDWLEAFRIPEDAINSAYDQLPGQLKAAIKSTLAAYDFLFPANRTFEETTFASLELGFTCACKREPVKLALIIFPGTYESIARVMAAAVPPILANVENILAISIDQAPRENILAALELCGIENMFMLAADQLETFYAKIRLESPPAATRMVILGSSEIPNAPLLADERGIIHLDEKKPPEIKILDGARADLIELAQGVHPGAGECPDAVFYHEAKPSNIASRLALGPGLECFWMFPHLGPEFFMREQTNLHMR